MLLLALACRPTTLDTDDSSVDTHVEHTGETGETGDTEETGDTDPVDTGPFDEDGDGFNRADDCDDDNPDVNPGATETFDGEDDDCDGTVDANGDYTGSHKVSARGWYQGNPHDFTFNCPTVLERKLVNAAWTVTCTAEDDDQWALLLVGKTLTLSPADDYLWELDRWEGDVTIASSNGWDTTGSGSASWKNMNEVVVSTILDTNYLDLSGNGRLYRE